MTVEELLNKVNSQKELFELIEQSRKTKKMLRHRASSTNTFLSNPLHYALSTCLGINFGGNEKTLFGTIVHEAVDYHYTNQNHRKGLAIKTLVLKAIEENQKIHNPLDDNDLKQIIRRAVRAFKKYRREIAIYNEVIHSELYLQVEVPTKNPDNQGKILFSGTFDRLYRENGKFILGDLKTSALRINAKGVEKSNQLIDYEFQIKEQREKIANFEKSLKKFANSEEKLKELNKNFDVETLKFDDAVKNKKASKAIQNRVEKLERDISLWESNLQTLTISEIGITAALNQISKIEKEMKPVKKIYDDAIKESELKECIEKHYLQVCLYALMYQIQHGIRIDRARIELIVRKDSKKGIKHESEEIQIFEWELTDELFEKADYIYSGMIIPTLEAFLDGTPASILFRQNPFSFFGNETNEILKKIS